MLKVFAFIAFTLPVLHVATVFTWALLDGEFCIPVDPYVDGYNYKIDVTYCKMEWRALFLIPIMAAYWLPLIGAGIVAVYFLKRRKREEAG
ncbi:MAG: hypothetical protein HQL36_05925 [Alphaproteobacteria bacterium]|nr:hypothetical protein [Alphaproteobacteria bacterium]